MSINTGIFREYDIRGITGTDIDEEVFELIGKAYGTYMKKLGASSISMGRDCRVTSPELSQAVARGINSTGLDVLDIGMVSTPMLYFSLYNLDVDGGVMITASHNPGEYNGIKLSSGKNSLFGEQIQEIREITEKGEFEVGSGSTNDADIREGYIKFLKDNLDIKPGLRVAADYGNGMTGIIGPEVFREFGCELTELYETPDGTFPNHHPDPTVEENLAELIDNVKSKQLEVGLGFDGDGDRIGVIDENGDIIWGDMLVLIFARDILTREKGAKFIGDVKCSTKLFKGIEDAGGEAIMWKTGHSLIKNKMKVENAAMAGEMSGHIFFADKFFGYDDALYAALRLLEIMSKTGKKVSELLGDVPHSVSTPEIRMDCPEEIKFQLVEEVKNRLSEKHQVIDIDGVRIEFADGWGLIRASNTQPALVLRFEAQDDQKLQDIRLIIEGELNSVIDELSS
ncbi:MAG: phosphomannomutase/phosphoglucomutase [Thermodesulfobacteriota bacterium]